MRKKTAKAKPRKSAARTKGQSARRVERLPIHLKVRYRLQEDYQVDLANDISPGGIFIKTASPLPRGTPVELIFGDPRDGKPAMTVEGKVVWSQVKGRHKSQRFGMGIEFARIDFEGQRFIDSIINDFLRKLSIV